MNEQSVNATDFSHKQTITFEHVYCCPRVMSDMNMEDVRTESGKLNIDSGRHAIP